MKYIYLLVSTLFFFFGAANAGELGVGIDGQNAVSEAPADAESQDSLWQELLEWFETEGSEEN